MYLSLNFFNFSSAILTLAFFQFLSLDCVPLNNSADLSGLIGANNNLSISKYSLAVSGMSVILIGSSHISSSKQIESGSKSISAITFLFLSHPLELTQ